MRKPPTRPTRVNMPNQTAPPTPVGTADTREGTRPSENCREPAAKSWGALAAATALIMLSPCLLLDSREEPPVATKQTAGTKQLR